MDTYVCKTKQIALRELYKYVKDWWPSEMNGKVPRIHKMAIDQYFETVSDRESWLIMTADVIE